MSPFGEALIVLRHVAIGMFSGLALVALAAFSAGVLGLSVGSDDVLMAVGLASPILFAVGMAFGIFHSVRVGGRRHERSWQ